MLTERGDDTPRRRIQTIRLIAGLTLHSGSSTAPNPKTAESICHAFPYLHYQLSPTCKAFLASQIGNQWIQNPSASLNGHNHSRTEQDNALTRQLRDPTKRFCIDITGITVHPHTSLLINGQELTPAKTPAFTFTAPETNQAGKQASAAPAFQWKEHEPTLSIDRTRALLTIVNSNIAWIALNNTGKSTWEQSRTIRPKGYNIDMSPESAVGQAQWDDPFIHASYDRMIAYKYAHGGQGRGSNTVVMIDLDKIRHTKPHGTILDIHSSGGRAQHRIPEDSTAAFYARKDAEILIKTKELSHKEGHILLALNTSQLKYPNRMISANETMLLADPAGHPLP